MSDKAPAWELATFAKISAYQMFWRRERRSLFWRGILPWNWSSNDIWTAYVMADRQLQILAHAAAQEPQP